MCFGLSKAFSTILLILLFALATPGVLAEGDLDENEEVVTEETEDEDEDVADIDDSLPRQTTSTQPTFSRTYGNAEDIQDKPHKIAPNIDLKEVAPAQTSKSFFSEPKNPEPPQDIQPEPRTPELKPEAAPPNSITLLDTEVLPGTSTRIGWSPGLQISGLSSPTPVLVVNGIKSGPTLCLVAAIHGDELNGIEIVRRVLYDLDPSELSGKVIGVPIVNLQGFQQGNRYLPDRRDLNRHFPGKADGHVAERFAHALFSQVVRHCDMLVDIHTGSLRRTNLPQLRADMNNPEVATFTGGFDRIAVVHSTGTRGMLRTAALAMGITAVTMEAGESLRIQQHQIKAGVNSLHSLMEKQGMISRLFTWGDPEPIYYDSYWIRAEYGGILSSKITLGAQVIKGQVLGVVTDPITNAQYPIKAKGIGRVIGMAVDQVVMSGFAAYHIGTEAEVPAE